MIVADTHAFFWWAHNRANLSKNAHDALSSADRIVISTITCWEIAMLARKGRITIGADPLTWILESIARTGVEPIPLSLEAAVRAVEFQQLRDPSDQQIVATALDLGVPLVTKDDRIRRANVVETIW
jgi:PIN domain nuclease of toxin-antitoxin system